MILSQNCSGLGDATKIKYLEDPVLGINPLGVVLTETRTMPGAKLPLALSKYKLFEGKAVRDPEKHAKSMIWGVSIAIKSEYLPELVKLRGSVLQGRCVAVDIIIPLVDKSSTSVRIIAIYAPQIGNSHVSTFWAAVDALLLDPKCPANWAITGDFNLTTCPAEATSRSWKISTSLTEYCELLNRHEAQDVWEATPDRSVHRDWTWQSFCDRRVRSMIDREATNAPRGSAEIRIPPALNPLGHPALSTKAEPPRADHCPTLTSIRFAGATSAAPTPLSALASTPHRRRVRFPDKLSRQEKFTAFADQLDELLGPEFLDSGPVSGSAEVFTQYGTH